MNLARSQVTRLMLIKVQLCQASTHPPGILFQWCPNHITYLGLKISNEVQNTFFLNLTPLLKKTKEDCKRWNYLPLSLIGRINCIKMNILPKYLYLFQMLLTSVPKAFFKQLNTSLTQFIWRNKPPRIKLSVLQSPLEKGGLKAPNFEYFYWAAHARAISMWQREQIHPPMWIQIEQHHLNNLKLESVPYISSLNSLLTTTTNQIIIHTFKIWQQLRKKNVSSYI